MSFLNALNPLIQLIPEVKPSLKPIGLKDKLMWTAGALFVFFILGQIYPFGADVSAVQGFERLEILLGSKIGTLITVGIGPIILASIFLQLAMGAGLIRFNLSNLEDRRMFQGVQKILAILLAFLECGVYVFGNVIPASQVAPLFGSFFLAQIAVMLQLVLGSIVLLYLDEVCQKYGIGSGISLFIAAGVSQAIFIGAFSLITSETGTFVGLIPRFIQFLIDPTKGSLADAIWLLPILLFTALIFFVVVFVETMKIEIPVSYARFGGYAARYPIKFMYVSNIPVILASAILLNVQLVGMFLANANMPVLGHYQGNSPLPDGIAYYLTALPSPLVLFSGNYASYLSFIAQPQEILHIFVYGLALVLFSVIFGWFWVESVPGMSASALARQMTNYGMAIPGFRSDPRIMEKILEKYIPIITILSSIFVGILAWFADIVGALGTGTGILLTVSIIYRFYEDLAKQQAFDMFPMLKGIVK